MRAVYLRWLEWTWRVGLKEYVQGAAQFTFCQRYFALRRRLLDSPAYNPIVGVIDSDSMVDDYFWSNRLREMKRFPESPVPLSPEDFLGKREGKQS